MPDDVLVASGVDGPIMTTATPPVTAIDLAPAECGRGAAALLAGILREERPTGVEENLPTRLVVRASTTPTTTIKERP